MNPAKEPKAVYTGLSQPFNRMKGCRLNGFLGLSLNDRTILSLAILLDKTVSVGQDSLRISTLAFSLNAAAVGRDDEHLENQLHFLLFTIIIIRLPPRQN